MSKTVSKKICNYCKINKELKMFYKHKRHKDGHASQCKDCMSKTQKKYRKDNIEKFRNRNKEYEATHKDDAKKRSEKWYEKNKQKAKDRTKLWRIENRDRYREHATNYSNKLRKRNPHICAWRNVLSGCLKRMGKTKEGHTIDLLGYSALELKKHISNLFTNGMSWDNYGNWHIDHIIEVHRFSPNTPVNIVNALSNLRPLWATTREIDGVIYEGNLSRIKNNNLV